MIAAIYARKSTEQTGLAEQEKSIARQIDHATAYAQGKGWTVAADHIYSDDGISGAEFATRPGFLRLMNALKPRPPFGVLVVSELSRLGREQLETGYAMKQLSQAGVAIHSYLEAGEILLDTPTDKFLMSAVSFAGEIERDKARQRTHDALRRKAEAGYVTGGRVFGYDNVEILGATGERSHVEHRINEGEAAVVREVFERCASGEGLKGIAKGLNAAGVPTPRAQRGRPNGWAPSSVRAVLHRPLYRGEIVWNRTRKRDAWGQKCRRDRPAGDQISVAAESLRIVPEALWSAAHAQISERRESYDRWKRGQGGAPDGRGVRTRYFLTGFGRCDLCGGSMQAVSRASTAGRNFRYVCATYWNRGASICANGRMVDMSVADGAVQQLLASEVLRPAVVDRALTRALDLLRGDVDGCGRREVLEHEVAAVEAELRNLAETAAKGGAVPIVLEALKGREADRQRLRAELAAFESPASLKPASALRAQLRRCLDDWRGLLSRNVAEARPLLDLVLADRIRFRPIADRQYQLTVPIVFDRVMTAAVPDLRGLQDRVASPTGFEPVSQP
jgi:site-specific DNA recombinase